MIRPGTYKLKLDDADHTEAYITVILNCEHTETDQKMVLFVRMAGDGTLWVMPVSTFRERAVPTGGGSMDVPS